MDTTFSGRRVVHVQVEQQGVSVPWFEFEWDVAQTSVAALEAAIIDALNGATPADTSELHLAIVDELHAEGIDVVVGVAPCPGVDAVVVSGAISLRLGLPLDV